MNDQITAAIIAGLDSMPIETRFFLYGIQMGVALAGEADATKREELIRCGLYEASNPGPNPGDHGPH